MDDGSATDLRDVSAIPALCASAPPVAAPPGGAALSQESGTVLVPARCIADPSLVRRRGPAANARTPTDAHVEADTGLDGALPEPCSSRSCVDVGGRPSRLRWPGLGRLGISFTVWDVGGQDKIRRLWRYYYEGTRGLIRGAADLTTTRQGSPLASCAGVWPTGERHQPSQAGWSQPAASDREMVQPPPSEGVHLHTQNTGCRRPPDRLRGGQQRPRACGGRARGARQDRAVPKAAP